MAFEADRVVVELIAKVDQFDQPVKQSATTFDASMGKIQASATKAEQAVIKGSGNRVQAIQRESAQIGQFSRLLGTQLNDVGALLSGPRSPFVVPVREAPKVSNALRLVQVGGAAMAGVLGGVVVTAAIAAAQALLELVRSGDSTNAMIADMVEKLKDAAEKKQAAARAADIFASSLEGVEEQVRANDEALKKLNDQEKTAARLLLESSIATNIRAERLRAETQALIDNARARLENNRAILTGVSSPQAREFAAQDLSSSQRALDDLQARLDRASEAVKDSNRQIQEALSRRVVEIAQTLADPIDRINKKYDDLIEAARERAVTEGTVSKTLKAQTDELEKQRRKEIEAARERTRKPRAERDAQLPKVTQAEVISVIKEVFGAGTRITSTSRTPAQNKAAGGAANSFHLSGTAIDFVPQEGMKAFDKELLRLALETRGIKAVELLGPGDKDHGDHGHVAFQRKRLGPDQVASAQERAAKQAERLALQELNREQAFQNEKANLEGQVIDARQSLIDSAEAIAELELQSIEVARAKYADQVAHLQTVGKLQEGEAAELLKLNEERAALRAEAVKRREDERRFRMREAEIQRSLEVQQGGFQAQAELLQSQEGLARTTRERREIEQRLLDLQFAEEKMLLEAQVARADRLRAEAERTKSQQILAEAEAAEADAAIARQRLATLPARQANATTQNNQQNASPLTAYFNDIQAQGADLNTMFESVAAGGLRTFTDALTDAIVNFRSLGDVGRAVLQAVTADLVRLAIQQIIAHTIGQSIQTAATAGVTAQMAAIGAAAAGPAALVSLATAGTNAISAQAGIASTVALATVLGSPKAMGGRIRGPGGPTSDRILTPSSADEYMIKAQSARQVGYDTLDYINRTGELPVSNQRAIRPMNVPAARPGSNGGSGFSQEDIAQLRGIVGEAIAAMPPLNLQPVISEDQIANAVFTSPRGRRVAFDFFGNNRAAVKAQLSPP